jgi:2-methylaconitate cis-trans-isomerase PrpF
VSAAPRLRVVLMRGGTSKGVFVREGDLPAPGPDRDGLLLRLMGSPDPMQLDGLGGSHSSTAACLCPNHVHGAEELAQAGDGLLPLTPYPV